MSSPLNVMKSYTSILAGICIPVRLPSVPNDLTVRIEGTIALGQSLAQSFHLLWHSFRDLAEEKMITFLTRLVFRTRGQSSRKRTILKSQRARFCINARENPFVADVAVRQQVNGGADVRPVPRFSHDGWFISLLSASRLASHAFECRGFRFASSDVCLAIESSPSPRSFTGNRGRVSPCRRCAVASATVRRLLCFGESKRTDESRTVVFDPKLAESIFPLHVTWASGQVRFSRARYWRCHYKWVVGLIPKHQRLKFHENVL